MPDQNFYDVVEKIRIQDVRYPNEAYAFINQAVAYTVRQCHPDARGKDRHVNGEQILRGTVELAQSEFGFLAEDILNDWGLTDGEAVGNVVFNMIHAGLLTASPSDSPEDFSSFGPLKKLFPAKTEKNKRKKAPMIV